jgi:hypothetical protein
MANVIKLTSAIILKANVGTDELGNDVYKNLTFKKVKASATDQDVLDVAQALALLVDGTVSSIMRQNLDEITVG